MPETLHRLTDIGCLVRIAEETPMVAIRQAIALARQARADLAVSLGVQKFTPPYSPFWTSVTDSIAADVNAKVMKIAGDVAERTREEAKAAGVNVHVEIASGAFADVCTHAAQAARAVDLVVVDQPHGALDTSEMLLEEALFRSGRPVLVASGAKPPIAEIDRIVIAWDGSAHAARAASDALFVFPSIRKADVVVVSGEKSLEGTLPADRFAEHLKRKGVETMVTDIARKNRTVAAVLDDYAQSSGADLIVMGGFGHARLMEFMLGGVTVELTENAKTPLLMAY
jgi:nucleotide-binding universal stress UspA family protein